MNTMNDNHLFVIRIEYLVDLNKHLFCDSKEEAQVIIDRIHEEIELKKHMIAITPERWITLDNIHEMQIIQKPADMPDWKWLG